MSLLWLELRRGIGKLKRPVRGVNAGGHESASPASISHAGHVRWRRDAGITGVRHASAFPSHANRHEACRTGYHRVAAPSPPMRLQPRYRLERVRPVGRRARNARYFPFCDDTTYNESRLWVPA